jgi:hypothetical protein
MRVMLALILSALLAFAASAHEFTLGELTVEHPWTPPSIAGQSQGAVYFTVRNDGDAPDRLIAARTDAAVRAELHGHVMTGDVMRMTALDAVEAPAHGEAALAPGGLHVMLFGLAAPLALDDRFTLTLQFERAGAVDVAVHVESLARHLGAPADSDRHSTH